jgi:hypothetical protein
MDPSGVVAKKLMLPWRSEQRLHRRERFTVCSPQPGQTCQEASGAGAGRAERIGQAPAADQASRSRRRCIVLAAAGRRGSTVAR